MKLYIKYTGYFSKHPEELLNKEYRATSEKEVYVVEVFDNVDDALNFIDNKEDSQFVRIKNKSKTKVEYMITYPSCTTPYVIYEIITEDMYNKMLDTQIDKLKLVQKQIKSDSNEPLDSVRKNLENKLDIELIQNVPFKELTLNNELGILSLGTYIAGDTNTIQLPFKLIVDEDGERFFQFYEELKVLPQIGNRTVGFHEIESVKDNYQYFAEFSPMELNQYAMNIEDGNMKQVMKYLNDNNMFISAFTLALYCGMGMIQEV